MLSPRIAVAVCQPNTFPGERSTPGTIPGGRPSPGDTKIQWERDTSTPGRTGRSREPSTVERIQLGFDSRFVS